MHFNPLWHDVKRIVIPGKGAMGDEYRTRRAAEREGRRTRRRREREKRGDSNHHDGMSTDDEESQSEIQLMQSDLGRFARFVGSLNLKLKKILKICMDCIGINFYE